jgi:exonuclease III
MPAIAGGIADQVAGELAEVTSTNLRPASEDPVRPAHATTILSQQLHHALDGEIGNISNTHNETHQQTSGEHDVMPSARQDQSDLRLSQSGEPTLENTLEQSDDSEGMVMDIEPYHAREIEDEGCPANRRQKRKSKKTAKAKAAKRRELLGIFLDEEDEEIQNEQPPQDEDMQAIEHNQSQSPSENTRSQRLRKKRKTRQTDKTRRSGVKIATLNIKGFGHENVANSENKWHHINQLMRDHRIAVLAVQETHMTEERRVAIENKYSTRMRVFASPDPNNPTGKAGVALVFNKNMMSVDNIEVDVTIPGRAMMAKFPLRRGTVATLLAVYAYNDKAKNRQLWRDIEKCYDEDPSIPKPDVILGDFNMVEDGIDRLPAHDDDANMVQSFQTLKQRLNLTDGWRETFPDKVQFSYMQNGRIHSRIDRIYVSQQVLETALQWNIEPSGIPNCDHCMAHVTLTDPEAPKCGKGRWTFPDFLLKDKIFNEHVQEIGEKMNQRLQALKCGAQIDGKENAQVMLADFKRQLKMYARKRERQIVPKIVEEQKAVEDELKSTSKETWIAESDKAKQMGALREKLAKLAEKRHLKKRKAIRMKFMLEGETMTKTLALMGKEKKPRDTIWGLKSSLTHPERTTPERESKKMAKIARDYHEKLQTTGAEDDKDDAVEIREEMIRKMLTLIETKPTDEQYDVMKAEITPDEVEAAMTTADNDSSTGLDGIPYELWKHLALISSLEDEETNSLSVVDLLTEAFNDIWKSGIRTPSYFAEGWMCPLYMKGDRDEVANYRPITLLNTDYKLFTKVLSTRITKSAPTLIHEAQAGFIPGRQISDHTQLTRMTMEYAEVSGNNGLIIALDQEKAYDKISHDYLWRVLKAFNIPPEYIQATRELYEHAETRVCVNGFMSAPYTVNRGVRQGDPLSCILFDLTIEPLAIALRKSKLKGIDVPGKAERLIATLFADDTTVYLSKDDDIADLEEILQEWCVASRAKFNVGKTIVVPIGEKTYRENVLRTRQTREDGGVIPDNMTILREGESTRILGAWFGNGVDINAPWSVVLNKMAKSFERWSSVSVNLLYKRHVIQCTAGGFSQYLAQVQGCPSRFEHQIETQIKKYLWGGKNSGSVNSETTKAPINQGGLKVLDIEARNDAIRLI